MPDVLRNGLGTGRFLFHPKRIPMSTATDTTPDLEDLVSMWDEDDEEEESPALGSDGPAEEAQAEAEEGAGEDEGAPPAAEAPDAEAPEGEQQTEERPEPEVQPERTQFGFRVDGRVVEVPGAETYTYPDGRRVHVIPDESFNRVMRHHLADRNKFTQERTDLLRRVEEYKAAADPQNNPQVKLATQATAFIEALLNEPIERDADAAERVLTRLTQWKANYPVWKAEQTAKAERERAESILSAKEFQPEPDEHEREQQAYEMDVTLSQGMQSFVANALQVNEFKDIPREDVQEVLDEAWENRHRYVGIADQDVPELGIVKGQPYYDFRPILSSLQRAQARAQRYRQSIDGVRQQIAPKIAEVAQVARQNAAALKPGRVAGGAKPTGTRATPKKPKNNIPSKEEFREMFDSMDLLADDD